MKRTLTPLLLLASAIPIVADEVHLGDYATVAGMAVDAAGNVYFAGSRWTSGAPSWNQAQVLTKLDAAGMPVYTAHLGDFAATDLFAAGEGSGLIVSGVAVDEAGSAYITGYVNKSGLLPLNAAQPVYGGMGDAFVGRLNAGGSGFVYLTYLGGSGIDIGRKIAVDLNGNAYVTGSTCSTDFPTVNAAQARFGGKGRFRCDAFVAKLDPTGSAMLYSTYLGGSQDEEALAIAADSAGNAYVAGTTSSPDFPTANPLQAELAQCSPTNFACSDAFVTKLNAFGAIVYSTYLGGTGYEWANGIAADAAGNAYVTGGTGSCDLPTVHAFQPSSGDRSGSCEDAFVAKVDPEGQLVYATYLGGNGTDHGSAITVDAHGDAYVAGWVGSVDFPTKNSIQEPANNTGFVTKVSGTGSALLFSTYFGASREERNVEAYGIGLDAAGNIYVAEAVVGGLASDAFVLKIAFLTTFPAEKAR